MMLIKSIGLVSIALNFLTPIISLKWISLDLPCSSDRGAPAKTSGAGTRFECTPIPRSTPSNRSAPNRPPDTFSPGDNEAVPSPSPSPSPAPSPLITPMPVPTIDQPIKPNLDNET